MDPARSGSDETGPAATGAGAGEPVDAFETSSAATIEVEAAWCPTPSACHTQRLRLPGGSTLLDAVRAAGWLATAAAAAGGDGAETAFGIWGEARPLDYRLRDGDRVERYRPLTVDPKEARRRRHARQRAQAAGAARH